MLVTISGSKNKRTSGGINVGKSEHFEFFALQHSLYVGQGNSAANGGFQLLYGCAVCLETMCRGKPRQACMKIVRTNQQSCHQNTPCSKREHGRPVQQGWRLPV
jgi:hypothetical protein